MNDTLKYFNFTTRNPDREPHPVPQLHLRQGAALESSSKIG